MSRIKLVEVSEMTPHQRAQYDRFPSNLSRALLVTEDRLAGALPNLANALRSSELSGKLREAVILRVAALSHNAYERMQHLGQAHKAGWDDANIEVIERGDTQKLPLDVAAALRFVDQVVKAATVSDSVFADARSHLSDREIATVILLVGHYMMVARFTGILEVELDSKPDDWLKEH